MSFLATTTNVADPTPHLAAEGRRVGELRDAGLVAWLLVHVDGSGATFLVTTDDASTAREIVDSLPLVSSGTATVELREVRDPFA